MVEKVNILNIKIDNFSFNEFLTELKEGIVFTPNVDHLVKLQKDKDFYKSYVKADYRVCDSRILFLLSKLMNSPIKEQIAGSDLLPKFCNYHKNNDDIKIFLLGGKDGVALDAKTNINRKFETNIIIDALSPSMVFDQDEIERADILKRINSSGANVLVVGVGAPKQENWIVKNKEFLPNIRIFLAVGAALDFEAGVIKRSPRWVTNNGLEWAYRIYKEPKRLWKRYFLEDIIFILLIIKQRFGLYKNPWGNTI